ncbi:MAG: DUF2752 domain-containing protein [Deltaproteobacteria bacterium]|nr:DUF2752 domain-containing protein [Deltaproteobacteria bacterium]
MRPVRLTFYFVAPVLFLLLPTSFFETGHSLCLFQNLFGMQCPGCGMTRALSSLLHGEILSALRYNRSVFVIFPLLCFILVKGVAGELKGSTWLVAAQSVRRLRARVRFQGRHVRLR